MKIAVMCAALCSAGWAMAAPDQRQPLAVVESVGQRVQIEVPAQMDYPTIARDLKLEGRAVVQAVVGANGKADQVRIASSSGSRYLDQAALRLVRRSHFVVLEQANALAVNVPVEFAFPEVRVADY